MRRVLFSVLVTVFLCITFPTSAFCASEAPPLHENPTPPDNPQPNVNINSTPSGIPFSEMGNRIDNYIGEYLGETAPGAAVVVIKDGEIVFSKGYGFADIENQIPVDPGATVFEYASISKLFVWTSVMQLVEQGKLDLDADIKIYLPEDFSKKLKYEKPITMRDLMNHAAGFSDWIFDLGCDARKIDKTDTLQNALLASQPEQTFEPGTVSVYSNFGAALAAYVVECVSGQDYAGYEMENIIVPAGMTNTLNQPYWIHNDRFLESKAEGYAPDGRGGFNGKMWEYTPLYPCGAINGTAEDLARFGIALTPPDGAVCPLFDSMDGWLDVLSPSYKDPSQLVGTFHGFLTFGNKDLEAYGHSGNNAGFSSVFMIVPEDRFGLVALVNSLGEMDITYGLADLLVNGNAGPAGSSFSISSPDALPSTKDVEGDYVTARRFERTFALMANYMSLSKVTAIDENNIKFTIMGFDAVFRQTEPYVYQITSSDNPMLRMGLNTIIFKMDEGSPVQIMVGNGVDFTSLPKGREMPLLISNLIILVCGTLFFLVMTVVMIVKFLRKKRASRTRLQKLNEGLFLCGTLLAFNNIAGFVRMGIINNYRSAAEMMPHIWINWTLLLATTILLGMSLLTIKKEGITKKQSVLYIITVALLVLFIIVSFYWNFFAFL